MDYDQNAFDNTFGKMSDKQESLIQGNGQSYTCRFSIEWGYEFFQNGKSIGTGYQMAQRAAQGISVGAFSFMTI